MVYIVVGTGTVWSRVWNGPDPRKQETLLDPVCSGFAIIFSDLDPDPRIRKSELRIRKSVSRIWIRDSNSVPAGSGSYLDNSVAIEKYMLPNWVVDHYNIELSFLNFCESLTHSSIPNPDPEPDADLLFRIMNSDLDPGGQLISDPGSQSY